MANHNATGRSFKSPRHIRLYEYMMASPAWASLDCVSRSLYVEIARRYRGEGSNNGTIPFSVREAAVLLAIGRNTANRAFHSLKERGFIIEARKSGFNIKNRVSTEWLLTEYPDDRKRGNTPELATKEFMRWQSPEDSTVPPQAATVPPQNQRWP
jgi:DNA-binding transcriptional MocR family regulator